MQMNIFRRLRASRSSLVLLTALATLAAACGSESSGGVAVTRQALSEVTVAAIQYGTGKSSATSVDASCATDAEPDVCAIKKLVAQAQASGAQLIVTPEYGLGQSYLEPDPTVGENPAVDTAADPKAFITIFSQQARHLQIYLVIDLQTYSEQDSKLKYNTQVAFGPDGAVVGKHHKFELFDSERKSLTPGDDVGVFDTPFGKVGLLICADMYGDLRMHDELTGRLGARIVAVSSLWTAGAGHQWPRNYARNWGVYVASSNTTSGAGQGGGVFAPDGAVLKLDKDGKTAISLATIAKD